MFDWSSNQGAVQSIFQNSLNEISGSACLHRDINVSMSQSVDFQQRGQSRGRRRFHRTEAKSPMRFTILRNRVFRLLQECLGLLRKRQQILSGSRQCYSLMMALEKPYTQLLLQQL